MNCPDEWLQTQCAGETVWLSHERALWWPREHTLWITDPHFGKGAAFRRAGIGVPAGTTESDLTRLTRLIDDVGARRLIVLGDFFHAAPRGDEPWLKAFGKFRDRHKLLRIDVVAGNHDKRAQPPAAWNLVWHGKPLRVPPFVGIHEPESTPLGYALGGHLHPVAELRGGGERMRVPVFWLRSTYAVLPAFGEFTGGFVIRPVRGDRLYAVGPSAVVSCAVA